MSESKITKPMMEKLLKFTSLKKLISDFLKTAAKLELANFKDFSDEEKEQIIEASLSSVDIEKHILPIYQKYFTAEELLDIIAFFRSNSGQRYVAQQQKVSDAVMASVPKMTLEMTVSLANEIGKKRRDE